MDESPQPRIWFAHALRGIACSLVVAGHMLEVFPREQTVVGQLGHFPPGPVVQTVWERPSLWLEGYGVSAAPVGVALFFLVSGFVIPFSLRDGSIGAFVTRRFFRLYPTLVACLGVVLVALWLQTFFDGLPLAVTSVDLITNVSLLAPYTGNPWIEPVLWSLAVEELFYAVAAILAARRVLVRKAAVASVAVVLFAIAVVPGADGTRPAQFWLAFNATAVLFIFLGVVIHFVFAGRWRMREGLVIGGTLGMLYGIALYVGPFAPNATIYLRSSILALGVFLTFLKLGDRVPRWRVLDAVSSISYPLYMVHSVSGFVLMHAVYVRTDNYYLALAVALPVAVCGAALIHRLIEVPTLAYGRRLGQRLTARSRSSIRTA
ncbi:MAG TPA: acyltransferase [Acidimicrobiales bacterium]|nr:acyltransferase [Acidimicrobiales bacterium]